jgi:hypothetical protein
LNVIAPVLVPAVLAGTVWLFAGRVWKRPPAPTLVWGGAAAVAFAFAAGHVTLQGWPPWPPVTALHTLVYAALIGGVIAAAEPVWGKWIAARWPIRLAIAGAAAWFQFNTLTEHTWSTGESVMWMAAVTLTICAMWELLDLYAAQKTGFVTPIIVWMSASAVSLGLVFGASALLGQLGGSLAAAFGAAIVLSLWARTFPLNQGAVGLYALAAGNLLWQGHFYAELPLVSTLLLIAAPAAAWAGWPLGGDRAPVWRQPAGSVAAVLVMQGIALGIAYVEYQAGAAEGGEYVY